MGNTCGSRPKLTKDPTPTVLLTFYGYSYWVDDKYLQALRTCGHFEEGDPLYSDGIVKVNSEGVQFNFIWGTGLGRCAMRPRWVSRSRNVCVLIYFVDHTVMKDYGTILSIDIEGMASVPSLSEARIIVVVTFSEDKDKTDSSKAEDEVVEGSKSLEGPEDSQTNEEEPHVAKSDEETEGPKSVEEAEGPKSVEEAEGPKSVEEAEGPKSVEEAEGSESDKETDHPKSENDPEDLKMKEESGAVKSEKETDGSKMEDEPEETDDSKTPEQTDDSKTPEQTDDSKTPEQTDDSKTEKKVFDPRTKEEIVNEVAEAFKICKQPCMVMACLEDTAATMKEVMTKAVQWVDEMTPTPPPPTTVVQHKSLSVVTKMKQLAKTLPAKVLTR